MCLVLAAVLRHGSTQLAKKHHVPRCDYKETGITSASRLGLEQKQRIAHLLGNVFFGGCQHGARCSAKAILDDARDEQGQCSKRKSGEWETLTGRQKMLQNVVSEQPHWRHPHRLPTSSADFFCLGGVFGVWLFF